MFYNNCYKTKFSFLSKYSIAFITDNKLSILHYVCVMISEKLLAEVQSRLFFHKITKKKKTHKLLIFFFVFLH